MVQYFTFFTDYFGTMKLLGEFFYVFIHGVTNLIIAGNSESFSGNEGKDMKQRRFFTVNKKQYTVYHRHSFLLVDKRSVRSRAM